MKQIQNELQIISGMLLSIQGILFGGAAGKIVAILGNVVVFIGVCLFIKEYRK